MWLIVVVCFFSGLLVEFWNDMGFVFVILYVIVILERCICDMMCFIVLIGYGELVMILVCSVDRLNFVNFGWLSLVMNIVGMLCSVV